MSGKCVKNNQLHFKTNKLKKARKYTAFRLHLWLVAKLCHIYCHPLAHIWIYRHELRVFSSGLTTENTQIKRKNNIHKVWLSSVVCLRRWNNILVYRWSPESPINERFIIHCLSWVCGKTSKYRYSCFIWCQFIFGETFHLDSFRDLKPLLHKTATLQKTTQ